MRLAYPDQAGSWSRFGLRFCPRMAVETDARCCQMPPLVKGVATRRDGREVPTSSPWLRAALCVHGWTALQRFARVGGTPVRLPPSDRCLAGDGYSDFHGIDEAIGYDLRRGVVARAAPNIAWRGVAAALGRLLDEQAPPFVCFVTLISTMGRVRQPSPRAGSQDAATGSEGQAGLDPEQGAQIMGREVCMAPSPCRRHGRLAVVHPVPRPRRPLRPGEPSARRPARVALDTHARSDPGTFFIRRPCPASPGSSSSFTSSPSSHLS